MPYCAQSKIFFYSSIIVLPTVRSDSDDEEAELLRELEKIKAERAQERARKVNALLMEFFFVSFV